MFPNGLPGAALLLQRLVCSCVVIAGAALLGKPQTLVTIVLQSLGCLAAVLLASGLWTPFAGASLAVVELLMAVFRIIGTAEVILLATIGMALAILGPGTYSVDARLFGRKRIEIRNR